MELSCNQFESLLSFYINHELKDNIKEAFEEHLCHCQRCKEKYEIVCSIINEVRLAYDKYISSNDFKELAPAYTYEDDSDYDEDSSSFELSAYIDNELPEDRNIKIRQSIGSKPKVRKKVEKLYGLRKILMSSFNEQKNSLKTDYSKNIVKTLNYNYEYKQAYIHCLGFLMFVMLTLVTSLLIIMHLN